MFVLKAEPYSRALEDGLVLRSLDNVKDAERLIAFNTYIFGADVGAMTRSLIFDHPSTRPEYWLYIEDKSEIVSALVLIPWEWQYDGIVLRSAEMGIVGTHEAYRNRGLIRTLNRHFSELLQTGNFHLSHIRGIPYFYRQFGYEFVHPLESQWRLELHQITTEADPSVTFRLATPDDIPRLLKFEEATTRHLNLRAVRTADHWRYLLENTKGTATETETWLLEVHQHAVAYFRIPQHGFGEGLIISEASRLELGQANTLLQRLKATALEREKPYLRFNLSPTNDLLRFARGHGAVDGGGWRWQIRIVDIVALLRQLAPLLERRLAASPLANLSQRVVINLYRSGIALDFENGQLKTIMATPKPDHSEINIPPTLLAPLILGYRSPAELQEFYPDCSIYGQSRLLIETLFPRMQAFIDTIY